MSGYNLFYYLLSLILILILLLHTFTMRFHSGSCVDSVSKKAVSGH